MKNEETSNLLVWVKLDDGEYRAHLPNHPGLTLWLLKCGAEIGPYQLFGAFVPDGMDGVDYPTLGAAQRSAEHFTRYFFKLIQRDFFTKL